MSKTRMFVTVDIGNTAIGLAAFRGARLLACSAFATDASKVKLKAHLKSFLRRLRNSKSDAVIICSVVPKALQVVKKELSRLTGLRPQVVGSDIRVPLKSHYNKKQIGQDRLVCAYAAKKLYGTPAIVVDLGTAVTCDYVNGRGEYEGGIIIPGLRLSAESLFKKTALLPKVAIAGPKRLIGRDTKTSILSGLFNGYGALIDGLIDRICQEKGTRPKVILTGGYAAVMKKHLRAKIYNVNPDLVFKGLVRLLREEIS